jgi:hypothetical protein
MTKKKHSGSESCNLYNAAIGESRDGLFGMAVTGAACRPG